MSGPVRFELYRGAVGGRMSSSLRRRCHVLLAELRSPWQ